MNIHKLRNKFDRKYLKKVNKALNLVGITPMPKRVPTYFIELTNKCNLKCPMCPRSDTAERGLGRMDFELFKYVIDEIKGHGGATFIGLNRFGESLLYDKFVEATVYAKKQLPDTHLGVVSNATLLTKEMTHSIIDESALDKIAFSLDSLDPEEYASGRVGATLEKVLENIDYFTEYKKKKGSKINTFMNTVLIHEHFDELKAIYERFGKDYKINFKPVAHYGVSQNWDKIKFYKQYNQTPCIQPWQRMNIFYNGDVNICCGDVEGELIVGNIKEQSIREIWHSERVQEIRKKHMALDFDDLHVCLACSGINADWYKDSYKQQVEIYSKLDPDRKVLEINNTSPIVE